MRLVRLWLDGGHPLAVYLINHVEFLLAKEESMRNLPTTNCGTVPLIFIIMSCVHLVGYLL